ncbi:MAG: hypothetical protein M3Y84_12995 [Acidobacteriota bacterium]|nr:hypothetical protein [Acidobacteriota bacterium]
MRNSVAGHNSRGLIIILAVLLALVALPLLSSARSRTASTSVNIVNNSNWEIRHVYLQASDADTWSGDQLNGSVIAPGASYALSNAACDGQSTKVITEDIEGCFLSSTVSCGSNATWTITNDANPDCGN